MMRAFKKMFGLAIVVAILSTLQSEVYSQYAFKDVNVISFEPFQVTPNQTVLVDGDRIQKIGPSKDVQVQDFEIIDCSSKFLMPGMMDSHAHLPGPQGLDMEIKDYLLLQLAAGVTSLRVARHEPDHLELKERAQREAWPTPHMYLAAPTIRSTDAILKDPIESFKGYKSQGYSHVKYLSGLTPVEHEVYVNAALKAGVPFWGHLPKQISLSRALELRQVGIEHFNGYTNLASTEKFDELDSRIKETAKRKVFNCPTISWYHSYYLIDDPKTLLARPGFDRVPSYLLESWKSWMETRKTETITIDKKARMEVLRRFKDSGAPMLMSAGDGYFFVPGLAMYEEMKVFAKVGYSNKDILRFSTYNGADFFEQTNEFGNLKEGLRADLVLLDADPVEDLSNIHSVGGVMVGGTWHPINSLLTKIKEIQTREKPSQGINMNIKRTGIILNVEKFDECVAFYRDVFGLKVMHEKQNGNFRLTCLEFGGSYLMIETGGVAKDQEKSTSENPSKLRFNADDLPAVLAKLKERGIDAEIQTFDWGSTINLTDPDGNRVGIRDEAKFEE